MAENVGRGLSLMGFLAIFIAAAATIMLFASNICDNSVRDKNVKFVNSSASNGKINHNDYYSFARDVAGLGNYAIKIEHKSLIYYPDGDGGYREDYMCYYNDEILTYMYPDSGEDQNYEMKAGDFITVTITKKGSVFTQIWDSITGSAPTVISNYGLMVGQG